MQKNQKHCTLLYVKNFKGGKDKKEAKWMEQNIANKVNVLIVDDIVANLVLLSKIVSKLGYHPRPVVSVEHALKAMETSKPHLIILSVSMP